MQSEMWDVSSDYRMVWLIEHPPGSNSFSLNEIIKVPQDAPTGGDYRLMVSVAKRNFWTNDLLGAYGYSPKVEISETKQTLSSKGPVTGVIGLLVNVKRIMRRVFF